MSFAQKEQRNLHSDLAICNAALVGPWEWGVDSGELLLQNSRGVPVVFISEPGITDADARFIAEARTGWPHAIERALAAERKLAEIRRLAFNAKALGIKSAYIALDSILYEVGGHG
jgi:hypothetical protein